MADRIRQVVLWVGIVIAMGALLVAGSPAVAASNGGSVADTSATDDRIDPALEDAEGEIDVIVRFADSSAAGAAAGEVDAATLERTAAASQRPFERFAGRTDGVTIERQFTIANAAVVTVDTDAVPVERLLAVDGVDRVHDNFEIEPPEVDHGRTVDAPVAPMSGADNATWGVERIGAPEVWNEYDTRGDGVKVAVLDTGVDPSHPDLDLAEENWAEFNESGHLIESAPYDDRGHGTHVSSIVAGGNASGTHVGVAPNVTLLHGGVLTWEGRTVGSVYAGIEWAVENDADVISMSLGFPYGNKPELIEPIRNAEAAGTTVVAASGNSGENTSFTPANVYESIAVGSTTMDGEIRSDSSGERLVTDEEWSDPPSDWPDEYVVPDVAAPGTEIVTADVDGGYRTDFSHTSAAAPHVAGTIALLRSQDPTISPSRTEKIVTATATKPDDAPAEQDPRYGHGIVDAAGAMDLLINGVTVSGTVTDGNGTPLENVTVASGVEETVTDADGHYSLLVAPGNQTLEASGFGVEPTETVVNATGNETAHDIAVETRADVEFVDDAPESVEPGGEYDIAFRTTNVEKHTVRVANATVENVTLANGALGDPTAVDSGHREIATATVDTDPDEIGRLTLEHEFRTVDNESIAVRTAETTVLPETVTVGDDGTFETIGEALEIAANGTTIELREERYEVADDDDLEVTTAVTITAAESVDPTIAILDSSGYGQPTGFRITSDGVTIANVTITNGEQRYSTRLRHGIRGWDANDVRVVDTTVRNAEDGIDIEYGDRTRVVDSTVENTVYGITTERGDGTRVVNSTVENAERGIRVYDGDDIRVVNNTVENAATGITADHDARASIERNELNGISDTGVKILDFQNTVTNNTIRGRPTHGILIYDLASANVTGNDVTANRSAIRLIGLSDRIADNRLEGGEIDLHLAKDPWSNADGSADYVVGNEFAGNGTGIKTHNESHLEVVAENRFTGEIGLEINGTFGRSERNDFAAVNGTAIADYGPDRYFEPDVTSSLDYYGARGPSGTDLEGNVTTDYYLTAPPSDVAAVDADVEQFGYRLELAANETTAVSFPGPLATDLETAVGDFNGTIYRYDPDGAADWTPVTDGNETPAALEAYVFAPTEPGTVNVAFENASAQPVTKAVTPGWNFVGAPVAADAETAYEPVTNDSTRILHPFETPGGAPIDEPSATDWAEYAVGSNATAPNVSPHGGYLVHATDNGSIEAAAHAGMTIGELEETLEDTGDDEQAATGVASEPTASGGLELAADSAVALATDGGIDAAGTGTGDGNETDEGDAGDGSEGGSDGNETGEPGTVPASFYGTVTIDGEPASAGTEVVATIVGTERASSAVGENGTYGGPGPFDDKLVIDGSAQDENATVAFRVDGDAVDPNATWNAGTTTAFDITIGDPDDGGSGGGLPSFGGGGPSDDDETSDEDANVTDADESDDSRAGAGGDDDAPETMTETADEPVDRDNETTDTDPRGDGDTDADDSIPGFGFVGTVAVLGGFLCRIARGTRDDEAF